MGKSLYVRNLDSEFNASTLEDLFTTVGDVESAEVQVKISNGIARRVGYVKMTTEQAAIDCIARFHNQRQNGQVLVVTEDRPHVPDPSLVKLKKKQASTAKKKKK